jgi:hypothetical protein
MTLQIKYLTEKGDRPGTERIRKEFVEYVVSTEYSRRIVDIIHEKFGTSRYETISQKRVEESIESPEPL